MHFTCKYIQSPTKLPHIEKILKCVCTHCVHKCLCALCNFNYNFVLHGQNNACSESAFSAVHRREYGCWNRTGNTDRCMQMHKITNVITRMRVHNSISVLILGRCSAARMRQSQKQIRECNIDRNDNETRDIFELVRLVNMKWLHAFLCPLPHRFNSYRRILIKKLFFFVFREWFPWSWRRKNVRLENAAHQGADKNTYPLNAVKKWNNSSFYCMIDSIWN